MYLNDTHSKQTPVGENEQEVLLPNTDAVAAFKEIGSIEAFAAHCNRMGYSLEEQWVLIDRYGTQTSSITFGKALADYKEELGETIYRLSGKKMSRNIHPDDVTPTPAESGVTTAAPPGAEKGLPAFCLTRHGASLDNEVWDNFLKALMELGHIEPPAIAGFKSLLGIARHTGRYKPLREPVPFASSKKALAFLVSMMYGTLRYTLPYDVTVGKQTVRKGEYTCKPLIVTPSGTGPDMQGRTRDAYWLTVQQSVAVGRAARKGDGGSKHGFATARKGDLSPEVAAPLIALLIPMGCHRVEE